METIPKRDRSGHVSEVVLRRHQKAAAVRLLKIMADRAGAPPDRRVVRVGDPDISPDAVVAACEGPLGLTEFAFLLARKPFPPFISLLRPTNTRAQVGRLDEVEREFQEVTEAYGDNPRKWFKGLIFEVGAHLFVYTDQALQEYEGLDFIRFAYDRDRCVCSLEAFVEANQR